MPGYIDIVTDKSYISWISYYMFTLVWWTFVHNTPLLYHWYNSAGAVPHFLNKGHVVYHSAKFFSERILKHKWVKEILYLFITWHWLHCISLRIIVYCYLACFWLVILTDITVFIYALFPCRLFFCYPLSEICWILYRRYG